jgi:O-antigen ligase
MVIGRTGYLVLVALATYLFYCRFGKKGLALALFFSLAIGTLAYQLSDTFYDRTRTAIAEAQAWKPKAGDKSSIGLRLDYYSNTLAIIKDHPWFGVGVGGFEVAYSAKIKGTQMAPSNNPHNQYLLTSAQFGLLGMVALISLFATLLWQARYLAPPYRQIAYGVLFAFLIGNTFNSFMLDFTERLFFAWICGVLFSGLPERKTLDKHHRT